MVDPTCEIPIKNSRAGIILWMELHIHGLQERNECCEVSVDRGIPPTEPLCFCGGKGGGRGKRPPSGEDSDYCNHM